MAPTSMCAPSKKQEHNMSGPCPILVVEGENNCGSSEFLKNIIRTPESLEFDSSVMG